MSSPIAYPVRNISGAASSAAPAAAAEAAASSRTLRFPSTEPGRPELWSRAVRMR